MAGATGGAVSSPLQVLIDSFNALKNAGAASSDPPVSGTQADTAGWLTDAINNAVSGLNNITSSAGFPPIQPLGVTATPLPTPRPAEAGPSLPPMTLDY